MKFPRLSILFPFRGSPYGGANQFLHALRRSLEKKNLYAEDTRDADAILFNSHHDLKAVFREKKKFPNTPFIHRVDGPMGLYRNAPDKRDKLVMKANNAVAEGTVFQSQWSCNENIKFGWNEAGLSTVIGNAPDPELFNKSNRTAMGGKVRLIAASWSSNPNKGFDVYEYLDKNLDFEKYEMVFCGNSPIKFSNIRSYAPVESSELADYFKSSDIFITGSVNDPCSNTLIEALHCGLPAIARRSGGHPEIVGKGGELFDRADEVPELIERFVDGFGRYQSNIHVPSIEEIKNSYVDFARSLLKEVNSGRIGLKNPGIMDRMWARFNG